MKRDEFIYLIKEVYDELRGEFPDLSITTYRDGGSVAFFMGETELVMLAPVQTLTDKNRIVQWFNHIEILKEGCTKFEDSYKNENIAGRIMFDGLPLNVIKSDGERKRYKRDIINLLKSLRLNKYKNICD